MRISDWSSDVCSSDLLAEIPKSAASVAEVLRQNGYNTAFFGKHHNVPSWQTSASGPFDLWPTGLGFEYFFGFIGGDLDQWHPRLYRGITPLDGTVLPEGEDRKSTRLNSSR